MARTRQVSAPAFPWQPSRRGELHLSATVDDAQETMWCLNGAGGACTPPCWQWRRHCINGGAAAVPAARVSHISMMARL